jgi:CheY-like chemotaxis protein
MTKMLRRLIGEDVVLKWQPAADVWRVKVDPSQIDQILTNLCVNARDAIVDTGTITIETENQIIGATDCAEFGALAPGEYVRVTMSDTGCGMDEQTLSHIFEPFFTTKSVGAGTGLGLSMVYGAVAQNNGFVRVTSVQGEGTTLSIYLPRYAGCADVAYQTGIQVQTPRGSETILVVEDEPAMLKAVKRVLEHQGYKVLATRTPSEALLAARNHAGSIQLLLTDVILPEMNGRELSEQLLPLNPGAKRLFMSGYTSNVIARHGVLDAGVDFIQKPFTSEDLTVKIREVLCGENSPQVDG